MTKQTRLFLAEYEQKVMNLPPELKEYTIESMLHESANGATYRLVKDDGTRAVLKVRPLSKKELLKDEAKILQSLDADGHMAPRLYLSFTDEQYAFLVREFLEGVTLEEYYEKHGDLSEDALCFIGQSLCLCVAGLQEQKPPIIHRDIKPQNCILTPDGQIRLMDFDTARTYKDKQDSDTRFLGTKTTAAPEQYGFAQSDVRTDLYGIGKTLIFLATGGYDADALRSTSLNPRLKKLLFLSVSLEKENRPQNAKEFAKQLKRIQRNLHMYKRKRWLFLTFPTTLLFVFIATLHFRQPHKEQIVEFESDLMSEAVHTALGIAQNEDVLYQDLENITELGVVGREVLSPGASFAYFSDEGLGYNGEERPDAFNELGTITDLSLLKYMSRLKRLYLCHQPLSDIHVLETLELQTLALTNCNISDFSPLKKCTTLHTLYISGNIGRSLDFLSGNKGLEYLAIGDAVYDSLTPLSGLQLTHLHISEMEVLDNDLTPLSKLPELSRLSGANITKEQLVAFRDNPTLYNIDIWSEIPYDNLTLLGEMPQLRELSIYIQSLDGIENLPRLDYLYLGPPQPDLSKLAEARSLSTIDISPLHITDYAPLFTAPHLELILAESDQEKNLRAAMSLSGASVKIEIVNNIP